MFVLYGHDQKTHDAACGRLGDYAHLLEEVLAAREKGEDPQLSIGLTRRNFFNLDRMTETACAFTGQEPPDLAERFSVHPVGKIQTNFNRHLKLLMPFSYQTGIEIEFLDPDLAAILRNIERVAGPTNEKDLLRLLGIFAGTTFVGPKRLLIDPLYACNLDCLYCNNFSEPRKNINRQRMESDPLFAGRDKVLDFTTFEKVVEQAAEMGVEAVSFVGGGEPILHPRFAEMIAKACNLGFLVDFSTNGIALSQKLAADIARAAPDSVTFSIAAGSDESYRAIHPRQKEGTYQKVMANARQLADLRAKGESKRPLMIALHVLCSLNFHEPEQMVRRAHEAGFDEVWLQMLHVRDFCRDLILSQTQIEQCKQNVARARKLAEELGLGFADYIDYQLENLRPDGAWSRGSFLDRGCLVGWTFSILTCGGEVSFCCGWKFVDAIGETGFRGVWESEKYDRLRQAARNLGKDENPLLKNGKHLLDEFCSSCDNHNFNNEVLQLLKKYELIDYLDTDPAFKDR